MPRSIAQISKEVFDSVAKHVSGVVLDCNLFQNEAGSVYNPSTGAYTNTKDRSYSGKCIVDKYIAEPDLFRGYTVGPNEHTIFIIGLCVLPKENDKLKVVYPDYEIEYYVVKSANYFGNPGLAVVIGRN